MLNSLISVGNRNQYLCGDYNGQLTQWRLDRRTIKARSASRIEHSLKDTHKKDSLGSSGY